MATSGIVKLREPPQQLTLLHKSADAVQVACLEIRGVVHRCDDIAI